ncbi:MAG: dihydrolipoamide acetyltransferase family protein [Solidesulfovibrio sp. DCME]|uniref:dihydrolipoamide acetyltransferase family protein n=1 Tax=Solidesulfovibrio sp. DCME TaxID=3447380 RepID=UPI003D0A4B32
MSVTVAMPKLGLTMKTGKVSKWLKAEGDAVTKGEALFEVETDKITNTVEAPEDGILYQIVVPAGATVPVGLVLGVIASPGETPERLEAGQAGEAPAGGGAKAAKATTTATAAPPAAPKEIIASPAAKRLARELGVDLAAVAGTGPGGRIKEEDVAAHHEAASKLPKITPLAAVIAAKAGLDIRTVTGTGERGKITREDVERALHPEAAAADGATAVPDATAGVTVVPMTGLRRAIADNMAASLAQAAQLTLITEVDATESLAFLATVRAMHKKDPSFKVSLNDILILATSRALTRFPMMNATQVGDDIHIHADVNMGVAVAIEGGLIVPVLRAAHKKSLTTIAREAREIAGKARTGALSADDLAGGTFTISNMGRSPVDFFTPILKPTETGILGVGRVVEKPVVRQGAIVIRSMMGLSLTFDHRVIDGAPAGEFLKLLCQYVEQPSLILF